PRSRGNRSVAGRHAMPGGPRMSAGVYTLYGSEMSPYSHKVRSYMRYKRIPHRWVPSGPGSTDPEYKKHARVPIVPTLVSPDGQGQQDSTPIIEALEQSF